jgi:hypothetical protein
VSIVAPFSDSNAICPTCGESAVSKWAWVYAHPPGFAKCKLCGTRLRARALLWLWLPCELIASTLIGIGAITLLTRDFVLPSVCFLAALVLGLAPYYFGWLAPLGRTSVALSRRG